MHHYFRSFGSKKWGVGKVVVFSMGLLFYQQGSFVSFQVLGNFNYFEKKNIEQPLALPDSPRNLNIHFHKIGSWAASV